MTDREPDDLYDALRDRLADHGQEPPAPLWANIRAQLPPPVAAPHLRRRWSSVLLLSLLLAVVGTTGWQWWRMNGVNQRTSRDLATVSTVNTLGDADQMEKLNHTPTNQKHPSKTNNQPIITNPGAAKTTTNTGITSNEATGVESAFKHLAVATDSPKQPKIKRTHPAISETDVVIGATTATSVRQRKLTSPLASRYFAAHHFLVPSHGKFALRTLPDATDQTSTVRHGAIAALVAVSQASDARHAGHLASQEILAATLVSPASASSTNTAFSDSRFRKNKPELYTSAHAARSYSQLR